MSRYGWKCCALGFLTASFLLSQTKITDGRQIKCFALESILAKRNSTSIRLNQQVLLESLINYVLLKGIFCQTPHQQAHKCTCPHMTEITKALYNQTSSVLFLCAPSFACTKKYSITKSKVSPCGSASYFNEGKVHLKLRLTLPTYIVFNLTLWHLQSRHNPDVINPCLYVQNIIIQDDGYDRWTNPNVLNMRLCGTAPPQNMLSSTNRVTIIWESIAQYHETAGFCLTFQPVVPGYAAMEAYGKPYSADWGDNPPNLLRVTNDELTADDKKIHLTLTGIPNFFIKYTRGQIVDYTFTFTGSALEVPNFRLEVFHCSHGTDIDSAGSVVTIYDYPTIPFDQVAEIERYMISKLRCIRCMFEVPGDVYKSTIGDLTVKLSVQPYERVSVTGTVTYRQLPCPGQYCNLTLQTVPQRGKVNFSLSSAQHASQQRLLLSLDSETTTEYMLLTNLSFEFSAFTRFPCTYGGIYIYEARNEALSLDAFLHKDSLSLLAKICSPWLARIWTGGKSNFAGLYFNVRPLLFIVKSYGYHSSGRLGGFASLSDCAGVVNFLADKQPRRYVVPGRGVLTMPAFVDYLNFPSVRHHRGCLVIQNIIWGYEYNPNRNTDGLFMNFTSNISTHHPEHTIGSSSNGPPLQPELTLFVSCFLAAFPAGIYMNKFHSTQTLRPLRSGYYLHFSYSCLIQGERPFVIMRYPGAVFGARCMPSERVAELSQYESEEQTYRVPLAICSALSLTGAMYRAPYYKLHMVLPRPYAIPLCCILRIEISVQAAVLARLLRLRFRDNTVSTVLVETWWKMWKPNPSLHDIVYPDFLSGKRIRLFSPRWSVSTLFGDAALIIEFQDRPGIVSPVTPLLHMTFNYTMWQGLLPPIDTQTGHDVDPGSKHFCFLGNESCYYALAINDVSWEDAKNVCESRGWSLLTSPSDIEWKKIETLVAFNPNMIQGHRSVSVSFINLRYLKANGMSRFTWDQIMPASFQRWHIAQSPYIKLFWVKYSNIYEAFQEDFEPLVGKTSTSLQPSSKEEASCVAIVLYSTVQMEWVTVPCQMSFNRTLVICQDALTVKYTNNTTTLFRSYKECPLGFVRIGPRCHRMLNVEYPKHLKCRNTLEICGGDVVEFETNDTSNEQLKVKYYQQWLNRPYLDLFYGRSSNGNNTQCLVMQLQERLTTTVTVKGLLGQVNVVLCQTEMLLIGIHCLKSQYRCEDHEDGTCMLSHYQCDGTVDCPDGTDENDCGHVCTFNFDKVQDYPEFYCYERCFPQNCSCHVLYYQCEVSGGCIPASRLCDGVNDCQGREDEMDCTDDTTETAETPQFPCRSGLLLPASRTNDLIPDCPGWHAEDEVELQMHWRGEGTWAVDMELDQSEKHACSAASTECVKGFPYACYPRDKICVYEIEPYANLLMYCRNGAHLSDCAKHECPARYKCLNSYCIPFHYVCNGRVDCPRGEEEEDCAEIQCHGLLRCRHDNTCVHPHQVGDNITDCLTSGDDEALADITECPKHCQCLGHAIWCTGADNKLIGQISKALKKMSLFHTLDGDEILDFPELLFLDISNNDITTTLFPQIQSLSSLRTLRLANNSIEYLAVSLVPSLFKLQHFGLQENPLHTIEPHFFSGFPNLVMLNLSQCKMVFVSKEMFSGLTTLYTLDLSYNRIQDLQPESLGSLGRTVHTLFLRSVKPDGLLKIADTLPELGSIHVGLDTICPYLPDHVACLSMYQHKRTCCKLIESVFMEVCVWIISLLFLGAHAVALVYWSTCRAKRVSKILMIMSDSCGLGRSLYLMYVGILHKVYGRYFFFYESSITASFHCKFAGTLYTIVHVMALITYLTVTVHHYLVIVKPLKCYDDLLIRYFTVCGTFGVLVGAVLLYSIVDGLFFPTTPTCHMFPLTSRSTEYWYAILLAFLAVESPLRAANAAVYIAACHAMKVALAASLPSSGGKKHKKGAYFRLKYLSAYEIICLGISCTIQLLIVLKEPSNDWVLVGILVLITMDVLNTVFQTFTVSAFKEAMLSHTCGILSLSRLNA